MGVKECVHSASGCFGTGKFKKGGLLEQISYKKGGTYVYWTLMAVPHSHIGVKGAYWMCDVMEMCIARAPV